MEHVAEFLKGLPLFKNFSAVELEKLIEKGQLQTFNRHDMIVKFGQPGQFLGILIEGNAEAVVTGEAGDRRQLGLIAPGDFLGEMSLLTGEPVSADVIALEECQLLLIPHSTFTTFLATNPEAIKVMARTMTQRLRNRQQDEEARRLIEEARQGASDPYGLDLSSTVPMKILVINCGSSSLKYGYFDTQDESSNLSGIVDRIGFTDSRITVSSRKGQASQELGSIDHVEALKAVISRITDREDGVIRDVNELAAVGHRVVHGGDKYGSAVIIDKQVIEDISKNAILAPLHNPLNLMAIMESIRLMPKVPQVAVFDTGFHQKMPLHAQIYGLPYDFYEKDAIRRYGFHGISHNYVALAAAAYLKRSFREMKMITCHLGNGASLCAIDHGRSVDTSMGLTPLEGLMMGTRVTLTLLLSFISAGKKACQLKR
jgi:acetate kinase